MRDLNEQHTILFKINTDDALDRVQVALDFLFKDTQRSIHDKVADDFDYEELIAALLHAKAALLENTPDDADD
jgi:hypothetical protein